jgi:hypothetical protein
MGVEDTRYKKLEVAQMKSMRPLSGITNLDLQRDTNNNKTLSVKLWATKKLNVFRIKENGVRKQALEYKHLGRDIHGRKMNRLRHQQLMKNVCS